MRTESRQGWSGTAGRFARRSALLALICGGLSLSGDIAAQAAAASIADITHVRVVEADDFADDVGRDTAVLPLGTDEVLSVSTNGAAAAAVELMRRGSRRGAADNARLDVDDPIGITFDPRSASVHVFDGSSRGGDPTTISRGDRADAGRVVPNRYGIGKVAGVAVDPDDGGLFVLDGRDRSVVKVDRPVARGRGASAGSVPAARISRIDLIVPESTELKGLIYDPEHRALYTIDVPSRTLYRIDPAGSLALVGRFSEEHWGEPLVTVLAPSLDQTDEPSRWHLFVLSDTGVGGEVHEWAIPRGDGGSS